jgi:hypothetical protein
VREAIDGEPLVGKLSSGEFTIEEEIWWVRRLDKWSVMLSYRSVTR